MTNASVKNSLFVLSVVAVAAALSLGAFATTVHAADDSWGDLGGGGWGDTASYGGWGDTSSYDSGWGDTSSYNPGYYDTSSYNSGWGDTSSYNPGYYSTDSYNPGYSDTSSYNPGYYSTDSYNPGYTTTDSYNPGYTTTDSYNPGYLTYDNSYTPSYTYDTVSSYSQPFSYSQPYSYGGSSSTFVPPSYISTYHPTQTTSQPIVIQQQQQQQQQQSTPINIVNNNNNTNTNVNTTPVVQAQPQPIVQYVVPQYQQPIYYQQPTYYQQTPYCTITANVGANGLVWLTWSSNGQSAYISPNVGNVAPNGSTSLYTYGTSIYTMTVTGQGGTNTCSTQAIPQSVPSVSLSQIPYTGYDFGTFGNALYWLALISFAVAGAYLLVYFQGGAFALVGSTLGHGSHGHEVAHASTPVQHTETIVETPEREEPRDVFASLPTMTVNSTKDSMNIARSEGGVPRIVISRA